MKNPILFFILSFIITPFTAQSQQLKLNSYPSATATIYLDFDGEEVSTPVWNNGNTINCAPSGLSNEQVTEVFNRVAEDYRPFNINITTDIDVFYAAPIDRKMRVIITPTSSWFSNVGGVSFFGSFTWGDETPCFVFSDKLGPYNPKLVAECCSHESGHTLGLSHQSKYDNGCNLTATYNEGAGTGETSWAPIMGNSYYRNMSGWSNGPTPYGCSNNQDNLSILTSRNGFGYRQDDHSDDIAGSPTQINVSNIDINGVITTTTDKDVFTFSLSHTSNFHLDVKPFSVNADNNGADLDVKLALYDASKNLVKVFNPEDRMDITIDTILNNGTYYIVVEGTGNGNTTDYGSLGSYNIKGLYAVLPFCNIEFDGAVNNNQHQFNWTVSCNESISNMILQSSIDAVNFNDAGNVTSTTSYSYTPGRQTDLYYRLKVTSLPGNIKYSNTVLLKKINNSAFTVSTFVTNNISVIANDNFKYQLHDVSGNKIMTGAGTSGSNSINIQNKPVGIYILSLSGGGETKTGRILKL